MHHYGEIPLNGLVSLQIPAQTVFIKKLIFSKKQNKTKKFDQCLMVAAPSTVKEAIKNTLIIFK